MVRETEKVIDLLTRSEAERLLGFFKRRRSYVCPSCYGRCYGIRDAGSRMPRLAQLNPNDPRSTNLYCIVCKEKTTVIRKPCTTEDCPGNVIDPNVYEYPENARDIVEFEEDGQRRVRYTLVMADGHEMQSERPIRLPVCLLCEYEQEYP